MTPSNEEIAKAIASPQERSDIAEIRAAASVLIERLQFMRQAGVTFKGLRDLYDVLGYDRAISVSQYRQRYTRGGIAGRIVEALPKATWRGGFELVEDEDPKKQTPFEKAWETFAERLKVQNVLYRTDVLSNISTFAVILIGAPNKLNTELPRGRPDGSSILFLQPFIGGGGPNRRSLTISDDSDCSIMEWETDINSPRFGQPKTYQIKRTDFSSPELQVPVHWTRIIHVAENCLDDEVYGQPGLERPWNYLDDLEKVVGGGAEAFWLRANQGLHLDVDKDLKDLEEPEKVRLAEQAEEYQHQMRRMIRTRGVEITPLGSDVANFGPNADAILTLIAGSKSIPKRILTGSEMGELASTQDRDNWKDQVNGRKEGHADPNIIRQLVDRLIKYGHLPKPSIPYQVKWSPIETLSETEKAAGAKTWADTNKTNGRPVYTNAEIRDHWHGFAPLTDAQIAAEMPPAPAPAPAVAQPSGPQAMPRAAATAIDPAWQTLPEGLVRNFTFPDRRACAAFITALMQDANLANHHPDVQTNVDSVTVTFVTHSAGDTITELDYQSAARADQLAITYKALSTDEAHLVSVLERALQEQDLDTIEEITGFRLAGAQGSGNYGHAGRPGHRGGSAPASGFDPVASYIQLYQEKRGSVHGQPSAVQAQKLHEAYSALEQWLSDPDIGMQLMSTISGGGYTPAAIRARIDDLEAGRLAIVGGTPKPHVLASVDEIIVALKGILTLLEDPDTSEFVSGLLQSYVETGSFEQYWTELRSAGGAGSGNFGHAGRPGSVGGSASSHGGSTYLSTPSDALISLQNGETAIVSREDIRGTLERAAAAMKGGGPPLDLTKLTIEGTPIFAGGLNRPRLSMPQIPEEHRAEYLAALHSQGIAVRKESVSPASLLPTQNEINAGKVGVMLTDPKVQVGSIFVSKDGYVLDGHHRWAALAALDAESPNKGIKIPIERIMVPHTWALRTMESFNKKHGIAHKALEREEDL